MLDEDEMKYLLESLKDKDPYLRVFTINSIVDNSKREEALDTLINSLLDENAEVRARAAWALGKIKNKRASEPLIQSLNDDDFTTRKNSLRSLGEIVALEAIQEIENKLEDRHWEVRNEAAVVLDYLGWVPNSTDQRTYHLIAKGRWQEVLKIEDLSIELLFPFLKDEDNEVQRRIAWILGEKKDERAVQPLYDLFMTAKLHDVKEKSSLAIGSIGGTKAVELLQVALHDSNWFIRKCAATSLGLIKDKSAIEPLKLLTSDTNRFVSQSAREAIKRIDEKDN
ncbi:MAG: HEAT repeat domain-containing protein [Candidatus Heimdallarchaeota archaeon]|nr:HEAT repeat domain-containing protein [Candidatus Heimdallarchaeota archaeon]